MTPPRECAFFFCSFSLFSNLLFLGIFWLISEMVRIAVRACMLFWGLGVWVVPRPMGMTDGGHVMEGAVLERKGFCAGGIRGCRGGRDEGGFAFGMRLRKGFFGLGWRWDS